VSNDGNYLLINLFLGSDGKTILFQADLTSEENKNLNQKLAYKPIVEEFIAKYNYIHNFGKEFYFQTNHKAPLGKIVKF